MAHCAGFRRLLAIALLMAGAGGARAQVVLATWTGATGNWSASVNWDILTVPNNSASTYNVDILSGNASLDQVAAIGVLDIGLGATLSINNGQSLTLAPSGGGSSTQTISGTLAMNERGTPV